MNWPEPWSPIENPDEKRAMETELQREVKEGHPLFGIRGVARGRRYDQDDVLFDLQDGSGRIAEVHLTYREYNAPPFPWTCLFNNADDWAGSVETE